MLCPPNIDFELGNTSVWNYYTGTCCPAVTPTAGPPIFNRHTLTAGPATDPYGGFPIVSPGGGSRSMRLGNAMAGAEAEKARYYVHVPASSTNYSLIYRYAVVFQDPGHTVADQPRFQVTAYDSATGLPVECSDFLYVSAPGLPGFEVSLVNPMVYYKPWSTGMLNLSGLGGSTIIVDFVSADCALGVHFGYGYFDMTCGLFALTTQVCDTSLITITAPEGFHSYEWYDSSFTTLLDTMRVFHPVNPPGTTTYAVILHSDAGFGCADTLFSTVIPSHISLIPLRDTIICSGSPVLLDPHAADFDTLTYVWSPSVGLACATCSSTMAAPLSPTQYIVTVTGLSGCTVSDTVNVSTALSVALTNDTGLCDATPVPLAANATGFYPPFTWSWSPVGGLSCTSCSSPVASLSLSATYVVVVTDTAGCSITDSVTILRDILMFTEPLRDTFFCAGQSVSMTAGITSTAFPPSYAWSPPYGLDCATCATVVAAPASFTAYTVTATNSLGCTLSDVVEVTPHYLSLYLPPDTVVCEYINVLLQVSSNGIAPQYTWTTGYSLGCNTCTSVMSSTAVSQIYNISVTDSLGCTAHGSVSVGRNSMSITTPMKDTLICRETAISLQAQHSLNPYAVTYFWSPSTGLSCSDCAAPVAIPLIPTSYSVVITDDVGCVVSDTVDISLDLCDIWFPSAFTPNRDGLNDLARVIGHFGFFSGFSLGIYNRFGESVFFTEDIYSGWDGTFHGIPQDVGVYFYKILYVLNGERHMMTGDLTLIR